MLRSAAVVALFGIAASQVATPQTTRQSAVTLEGPVVALTEDPELRARFENDLVVKAGERNYDHRQST